MSTSFNNINKYNFLLSKSVKFITYAGVSFIAIEISPVPAAHVVGRTDIRGMTALSSLSMHHYIRVPIKKILNLSQSIWDKIDSLFIFHLILNYLGIFVILGLS
ncbi:hypothetical protein MUGA111182_11530 [Mucilaginibacter galii]